MAQKFSGWASGYNISDHFLTKMTQNTSALMLDADGFNPFTPGKIKCAIFGLTPLFGDRRGFMPLQ